MTIPGSDRRRGRAVVPRARRPAADTVLGRRCCQDAQSYLAQAPRLAVVPGPRDRARRARVQRPRRRPARHPRPAHDALMASRRCWRLRISRVRFDTDDGAGARRRPRCRSRSATGEVLGIVGESGCGKSVTVHVADPAAAARRRRSTGAVALRRASTCSTLLAAAAAAASAAARSRTCFRTR